MPSKLEENVDALRERTRARFAKKESLGKLSLVHDLTHVENVAEHAGAIAEALARHEGYGKSEAERVALLARAAGYLHDWMRDATELKPHGSKVEEFAKRVLRFRPKAKGDATEEEARAVIIAAGLHESNFAELESALEGATPLERIVARSLVAADKGFEASGPRVLERRSFFVGKERLAEGKDLHYLREIYGERAPLYAVAMESLMRLRAINALGTYPKWLRPIVAPLHATQEKFYYGLLKRLGFGSERELFEEMKRIKFPKADKYEETILSNIPGSVPEVGAAVNGAAEVVMHYSKAASPEEGTRTFEPKSLQAKAWLRAIRQYHERPKGYMDDLVRKIRMNLAKKK